MKKIFISTAVIVSFIAMGRAFAQQGIVASYGNASDGAGNSVTYSSGQIAFKSATSSQGYIIEGLQQPKENSGVVLPITLLYFKAKVVHPKQVDLNWETANEMDNAFFNVERSADAKTFETIGKVNGGSATGHHYVFNDLKPLSGYSYYRLKQHDENGAFSYSNVERVSIAAGADISALPNPFTDHLTLSMSAQTLTGTMSYTIADVQGRTVLALGIKNATTTIDVSNLPSGVYILRVTDGSNLLQSFRIVKP